MTRLKPIFRGGRRGWTVRVVPGTNHGAPCWWCYYRAAETGRRSGSPFPKTPAGRAEAIAFAQGIVHAQSASTRPRVRLTLAQLWAAYVGERGRAWRPNTRRLYLDAWTPFEALAGPHTIAEDVGRQTMVAFVDRMEARWSAYTIRKALTAIRQVYRYGIEAELLERDRVSPFQYRVAKERRPESPAEYSMEEFGRLLEALPLDHAGTWRAHVALGLCGYQGMRQHQVLHLRWEDLEAADIIWRAAWHKDGREERQPLREPTRHLLEVAKRWRESVGYDGPWVLFAPRRSPDGTYQKQTLWWNLIAAEQRAGIAHRSRRGGHGLRRLLAGEVNELTGDAKLAMDAIGDRDIRQAQRYLKRRDHRVRDAFAELDRRHRNASEMQAAGTAAAGGATGVVQANDLRNSRGRTRTCDPVIDTNPARPENSPVPSGEGLHTSPHMQDSGQKPDPKCNPNASSDPPSSPDPQDVPDTDRRRA